MAKLSLICEICGSKFERVLCPSQIARGEGKYCSTYCRSEAQKQRGNVARVCEVCKKPFRVWKSQTDGENGKYCSWKCYSAARRDRITLKCDVCGKEFETVASAISLRGRKHCSKDCKRIAQTGPHCYMWKGGKSFEPYCVAFSRKLKEEVRDAFGRKCFLCGVPENGKKLHVHHVDYDKSQGCKGKRWGLIPLCNSCHAKTNVHRSLYFNMLRDYWIYNYIDFIEKMAKI